MCQPPSWRAWLSFIVAKFSRQVGDSRAQRAGWLAPLGRQTLHPFGGDSVARQDLVENVFNSGGQANHVLVRQAIGPIGRLLPLAKVECLGVCANAPMVQIGKDTYEDLTPELFEKVLDGIAKGEPPKPGSQIGRQACCPAGGPTTLKDYVKAAK